MKLPNEADAARHMAATLAVALLEAKAPLDETERTFCEVTLWDAPTDSRMSIGHRKPGFVFPPKEDSYKREKFLELYPWIESRRQP